MNVAIIINIQLWNICYVKGEWYTFSIVSMYASLIMKNVGEKLSLATFHQFITCKMYLTILLFLFFQVPNICPPRLLILKYPHDLKLIRAPVYSFLDLINLTRYLLTSKWFVQIFLYHCILRFLQIKSVQVCAPQNAGDSLKKPLPPIRATNNIISCFISCFRKNWRYFAASFIEND